MNELENELISSREAFDERAFESSLEQLRSAFYNQDYHFAANSDEHHSDAVVNAVLRYFGISEVEPRANLKGLEAYMNYALRPAGITWRTVQLTDTWWKDCPNPLIATLESGETIALFPRSLGGYDYFDPATGRGSKLDKATRDQLKDTALCLYRPLPPRSLSTKDLIYFILKAVNLQDVLVALIANAAAALVALIPTYGNLVIFNQILGFGSSALPAVICMLVGASISTAMFMGMKVLIASRISIKIETATEAAVVSRLLALPLKFFEKYSSGELAVYATSIRSLCQELVNTTVGYVLAAVFSLVYLIQIATFAPGMVTPCLIIVVFTAIVTAAFASWKARFQEDLIELDADVFGLECSLLSDIQKLRLAHAERRGFAKWATTYATEVKFRYNPPMRIKAANAVVAALTAGALIFIYVAAANFGMTSADYMAFSVAYGGLSAAFLGLAQAIPSIATINSSLKALEPILEATPESSPDAEVVTGLSGSVEFENVCFRYGDQGPVIADHLSFSIKRGQYVALVGKSGCGKSSLLRLLLGFEEPQSGAVLFDGHDLSRLDAPSLRRHIGIVEQEGKLFKGNIFKNIAISTPGLSMEDAWKAAAIASVDEDIKAMPMGMQTHVSEGGGGMSGGQRQRILIARAVAGKPRLLIMDEATSALDNITQKSVCESLDKLKCTRIVVAHRLSTIKQCNRILYLENGRIIEDGNYEQLMNKRGAFYDLVKRQQINA